jgi:hypothetical protein
MAPPGHRPRLHAESGVILAADMRAAIDPLGLTGVALMCAARLSHRNCVPSAKVTLTGVETYRCTRASGRSRCTEVRCCAPILSRVGEL